MPPPLAGLRFPSERALLSRTKLAYVNLPRLLSDAKRDRSARVSAYVAIWLPECLVLLFLKGGELITAASDDGRVRNIIPLADALARVPSEPEWGEICFAVASDDQLLCMFSCYSGEADAGSRGSGLPVADYLAGLRDAGYSGVVEVCVDGAMSYLMFQDGRAASGFVSCTGNRSLVDQLSHASDSRGYPAWAQCYALQPGLPVQAQPQLVRAYRELMFATVAQLVAQGRVSAPAIAEHARSILMAQHPNLAAFAPDSSVDPVCTADELSRGIGAWITETIWAGMDHESAEPQELLRGCTRERRHMFQSAGFFEHIPWKLEW